MSKKISAILWSAMERLRFIERRAFWCGKVTRQDLAETYGLSLAQATADLQKYQEMNAGALVYNLRKKRYEGAKRMKPLLHEPRLEEAVAQFLPGTAEKVLPLLGASATALETEENALADRVVMPVRRASLDVERRVFLALREGWRVRVKYYSVNSSTHEWRWLSPGAFAHDGSRWHVRAWCEKNNEWRDFNVPRISEAEWPVEREAEPPRDEAWHRWVTLRLRPHRALEKEAQAAVEYDYGMTDGVLELRVREALADYTRDQMGVPLRDGKIPSLLLEVVDS